MMKDMGCEGLDYSYEAMLSGANYATDVIVYDSLEALNNEQEVLDFCKEYVEEYDIEDELCCLSVNNAATLVRASNLVKAEPVYGDQDPFELLYHAAIINKDMMGMMGWFDDMRDASSSLTASVLAFSFAAIAIYQ